MCVRGDGVFSLSCYQLRYRITKITTITHHPYCLLSHVHVQVCAPVPLVAHRNKASNRISLTVRKNWISSSASPPSAMAARSLLASSRTHTRTRTQLIHSHAGPQPLHRSPSAQSSARSSAKSACARAPSLHWVPRRTGAGLPDWFTNLQFNSCSNTFKGKVNHSRP